MPFRLTLLTLLALLLAGVVFAAMMLGTSVREARVVHVLERPPEALHSAGEQLVATALPTTPTAPRRELEAAADPLEVEELWLTVRVVARAGFNRTALPAVELEVSAGVGHPYSPNARALATGRTDSDGLCELRIPWPAAEAARSSGERVWARPSGPGWIHQTKTREIPEDLEPVEIPLIAQPGFTVRGRLLGEHGEPTSGRIEARGLTLLGERASGQGKVGADGWFELHLSHAGTYDVIGSPSFQRLFQPRTDTYAGVGSVRGVVVSETEQPEDLVVQLAGPGVVRGRVQTTAGQPVAGLDLIFSSTQESSVAGTGYPKHWQLRAAGQGASGVELRTDADGYFEARGLRADTFDVRLNYGEPRLNQAPVPSDGVPVVLVVDHTQLVVRIVDESGVPWQGQLGDGWTETSDEWDDRPEIVVVPTRDNPPDLVRSPFGRLERVQGNLVENTSKSFEVRPGGEYLAGIMGGPGAWNPIRVHVPDSGGRVEVELRIGRERARGTLSLSVTAPTGPIVNHIIVQIEDLDTGFSLLAKRTFYRTTWPLELQFPAGSYRLSVEGLPSFGMHGDLLARSAHGRFEADFSITPGTVTELEAHLPAGARIDLTLETEATRRTNPEGTERSPTSARGVRVAQVRLLSADRWPRPVEFKVEQMSGHSLTNWVSPGTRQISELLPAGHFMLEVHARGGRVASVPVTLVDGEMLSVTLEL